MNKSNARKRRRTPRGAALSVLFAVFVQLYSFTAYVNINLHVALRCRHFSSQWKCAAAGLSRESADRQAALDSEPAKVADLFVGSQIPSLIFQIRLSDIIFTSYVCISDENEFRPPNIDGRPGHQLCRGKYALISASQRGFCLRRHF